MPDASDVLACFRAAAGDRSSGATEIERELISALLGCRASWQDGLLREGAAVVAEAHPGMANLRTLCLRATAGGLPALADYLAVRSEVLDGLCDRLAANAWQWIEGRSQVLSLSRSSAVAAALLGAHDRGWRGRTVIFDGSPAGCGAAQAERLAAAGLEAVSQPDAAVPAWLDRVAERAVALVGADAVSDRRIVNATGTRLLLELATARAITTVLVADTAKQLPDALLDRIIESSRCQTEVGPGREWPVFEVVPMEMVHARVDESREPKDPLPQIR